MVTCAAEAGRRDPVLPDVDTVEVWLFCLFRPELFVSVVLVLGAPVVLFNASLGRSPVVAALVADPALAPSLLRVPRLSLAVPTVLPAVLAGVGRVSFVRVPAAPPADARLADPSDVLPCVLVGAVGDRLLLPFRLTPDDILPDPLRCIPVVELDVLLSGRLFIEVCASNWVDTSEMTRPVQSEFFMMLVE